jgi:hypothetical protein
VNRARPAGFDPDGYLQEDPLRRDIFYISPFLSCRKCNAITCVDASILRSALRLGRFIDLRTLEALPPCGGCQATGSLSVGAESFLHLIAGNEEGLRQLRAAQNRAVRILHRSYQAYLLRCWGKAFRDLVHIRRLKEYRCAQVIQTVTRRRLGQRTGLTERWLLVLRNASPLLLEWATTRFPERKPVFWYRSRAEEQQLFDDYLELAARTGFLPPRSLVEANIKEVAQRVQEIERELATRVQRRWRGILVRRALIVFFNERRRLRELRNAMVFRIQRTFRGWSARLHISEQRDVALKRQLDRSYKSECLRKKEEERESKAKGCLKRLTQVESRHRRVARLMGKSHQYHNDQDWRIGVALCRSAIEHQRMEVNRSKKSIALAALELHRKKDACKRDPAFRSYYELEKERDASLPILGGSLSKCSGRKAAIAAFLSTSQNGKPQRIHLPLEATRDKEKIAESLLHLHCR